MVAVPALDPERDEPLYRQLYAHFRDAIASGRLAQGERVPPTRELATQLNVNRATVAAAYELLESDGLIRGHVGRGSFVAGLPTQVFKPTAPAQDDLDRGSRWAGRLAQTVSFEAPLAAPGVGPDAIDFTASRPAQELFPVEEFRQACDEVVHSSEAAQVLQLGPSLGYPPLRRLLLEDARRQGIARDSDDILITSGCQQAMDLLQRTLCRQDDSVLVEDPLYPGLKNVFTRAGVRLLPAPIQMTGLDVEAWARIAERERPMLAVTTPNFQNPTGTTISLPARQELLRAARQSGVPVIENDLYGDLRYTGESLPSLKQLDEAGEVVHIRSFSKIAFPGLRVGWIIGPRVLISRLAEQKQWTDLHSDQLAQAVLARFVESGRLARHREKVLKAGRERLNAVLSACASHLPEGSRFTRAEGGMNVWVRLPEPLDAAELLPRAQRENVVYLPGRYFAVHRAEPGSLRLSFAGLTPERIEQGLSILGRIFRGEWERSRSVHREDLSPAIV